MDSFPYESWAEAIEKADQSSGYFTFGPGNNTATYIIVAIAIAISVGFLVYLTNEEDRHLAKAADTIANEWKD